MTQRLGNGLPLTLTPKRIQGILKFAKSQEKELRETLDRNNASAWQSTNFREDLYHHIHGLLQTVGGRKAYDEARRNFENAKRKRLGRADLFDLLWKDVCRELSGTNEFIPIQINKYNLNISEDTDKNKWDKIAESVWLYCVLIERDKNIPAGNFVIEYINRYPNLGPYLEEVQRDLVSIEDSPKYDTSDGARSASSLIDGIKGIAADLHSERLDKKTLEKLHRFVQDLIAVAETIEKERQAAEKLRDLISNWREQHSDDIEESEKIDRYVSKLEALIEDGEIDQDSAVNIISHLDDASKAERLFQETWAKIGPAVAEQDFDSVRKLTDASEFHKTKRDAAYASIDIELPEVLRTEEPKAASQKVDAAPEPESDREAAEDGNLVDLGPTVEHQAESTTEVSRPLAPSVSGVPENDTATKDTPHTSPNTGETQPTDSNDVPVPQTDNVPVAEIEAGIAMAINCGRFSIAYHLARTEPEALPSANAVKLVACNYATDDPATVAAALPDLADALLQEVRAIPDKAERKSSRDYVVLLASAALAPALSAPGGPVGQLLLEVESRLDDDMPALRVLAKTTADFSVLGVYLPARLLQEGDSLEKWEEEEKSIQREVDLWIENNRSATIKYQRATVVWKRMIDVWEKGERSSIGWIFEALKGPFDTIDVDLILQRINHWRDNGSREIDRIDREKHYGPGKIEGSARMDLRNKIGEAVNLAERWCRLIRGRPTAESEFQVRKVRNLRDVVHKQSELAINEVRRLVTPMASATVELISKYTSVFEKSDSDEPDPPMRLSDLVNGWLLLDPRIRFDESSGLPNTPLNINRLMDFVRLDAPDFGNAAIERARSGDFRGADSAIAFARRSGFLDDKDADGADDMIDEERRRARQKIEERIKRLGEHLDDTYARGIISLETFERLRSDISSVSPSDIVNVDEIGPFDEYLDHVHEQIDEAKGQAGERLGQLFATLKDVSSEDKKRIQGAINEQRLSVAEDYIERIGRGENLPETKDSSARPFDNFFPKFVDDYISFQDRHSDAFEQVRKAVKSRTQAGPIDATRLSENAVRDGGRLLERWSSLRTGRSARGNLTGLFDVIGFMETEVQPHPSSGSHKTQTWTLNSKPVSDRNVCRLADFGSRAQGRYRLIVIEDYTTEEKIIQEVGGKFSEGGPPNIVLFLNALDTDARRALALGLSIERCRPTLVLDEVLAVFLATRLSGRLAAFFDCTSAFTFAQPFDPDATEVPPEMFFGRDSERRAILAMSGSAERTHLVYGGRRLGKTALLTNIAHTCRAEQSEWIVSLINLKGTGIGGIRPADELWKEVAIPLVERKIVGPNTVRPGSIGEGVRKWLDGDSDRRILLLVDEADDFLETDERERYRVLEEIKNLMDRTKRRFKVVFAGLHNVQRTARDPNTPFAHLGEPIRIGPMLPETDPERIEDLIRDPLAALGYRFASIDSVIRIAAETNYYPALAQQFCKELLRDLRGDKYMRDGSGPPYMIPPETVDRVLGSKETRERIRNLFLWTIQLDPRYEVLTYLIAKRSFDNGSTRLRSVSIDDIRQMALEEWPKGFGTDSTFLMFQVLLEEMVGLGILRKFGDKEDYAIRTRNLRMLLGNDDEIKRRLSDAVRKPPPPKFDPALFRNTLDDGAPSPITASQENQILSGRKAVGLVFGTILGGLDRVDMALIKAGENKSIDIRTHKAAVADMDDALREISHGRTAGIDIVLIDAHSDWEPEIINRAVAFVARSDFRGRMIRPVFLLGPGEAWRWLEDTTELDRRRPLTDSSDVRIQEIWLAPCARDFTRTWLTDREAPAYAEVENPDQSIDPLWPVVALAAARDKSESIMDAIDAALSGRDLVSDILLGPEMRTALSVLLQFPDDPMAVDDLCDFANDPISPEAVRRVFGWGHRLGILRSEKQGFRLDSTYAAGLKTVFKE